MKNIHLYSVFLLLFVSQVTLPQPSLKLKTKKAYEQETETVSVTQMTMLDQKITLTQNEKLTSVLEIQKHNQDQYTLASTLIKVDASVEQMGQEATYNSDEEDAYESPLAVAYKDLFQHELKFHLDSSGKLIIPENKKNTKENYSYDAIEAVWGLFMAMPDSLNADSQWQTQQRIDTDKLQLISTFQYRVKSITDSLATLKATGKTVLKQDVNNSGVQVVTNLITHSSGEITLHPEIGIIITKNTTEETKGSMFTKGMEIPLNIKSSHKIKISEM